MKHKETDKEQRDPMVYGIAGVIIGGVTVWILTSSVVNTNNAGMMRMMGIRTTSQNMMQNQNSDTVDAHFIEQMIPHHQDAVTMAALAQSKAQRPEVKELAMNIIDDQNHEIEKMKVWYKEWFGRELPTSDEVMTQHGMKGNESQMHMGMMGDNSDMTRLENAEDFDKAFVEAMIPHHQMAVMMASMLKDGTKRPEMKKLADDIVAAQTSEIDQMRQWLSEWQ